MPFAVVVRRFPQNGITGICVLTNRNARPTSTENTLFTDLTGDVIPESDCARLTATASQYLRLSWTTAEKWGYWTLSCRESEACYVRRLGQSADDLSILFFGKGTAGLRRDIPLRR